MALQQAGPIDETLATFRVQVASSSSLDCRQDIHWLMENGDRRDNVVSAIEAAVTRGMTDMISAGLHHKFAHVQAIALNERAKTLEAPFPAEILGLIAAQGYPIRRAIVDLLAANPHPAHLDTLIELLADGYAERSHYGDEAEHPIARRAAEAIEHGQYDVTAHLDQIWAIAEETYDASVRFHIYWLVTATGNYERQLAVLKVAVQAERRSIRHIASGALRTNWQKLDQRIVDLIKTVWIRRKWEPVAADFAIILGARATDQVILEACESLAADRDRRVIMLAILAMVKDRSPALANRIAAMLPPRNKVVPLVLSDSWNLISAKSLERLGGTAAVKAVMSLVAPSDS
jgi:hypothetical protein